MGQGRLTQLKTSPTFCAIARERTQTRSEPFPMTFGARVSSYGSKNNSPSSKTMRACLSIDVWHDRKHCGQDVFKNYKPKTQSLTTFAHRTMRVEPSNDHLVEELLAGLGIQHPFPKHSPCAAYIAASFSSKIHLCNRVIAYSLHYILKDSRACRRRRLERVQGHVWQVCLPYVLRTIPPLSRRTLARAWSSTPGTFLFHVGQR